MTIHHSVIRSPSITEKNTALKASQNKYVFEVDTASTKIQIKRAVEEVFGVKVVNVRTMIVKGKKKRMGRYAGYRPNRKKAIVKLEQGQKIAQFGEG